MDRPKTRLCPVPALVIVLSSSTAHAPGSAARSHHGSRTGEIGCIPRVHDRLRECIRRRSAGIVAHRRKAHTYSVHMSSGHFGKHLLDIGRASGAVHSRYGHGQLLHRASPRSGVATRVESCSLHVMRREDRRRRYGAALAIHRPLSALRFYANTPLIPFECR